MGHRLVGWEDDDTVPAQQGIFDTTKLFRSPLTERISFSLHIYDVMDFS
jgi:hypothetical protein